MIYEISITCLFTNTSYLIKRRQGNMTFLELLQSLYTSLRAWEMPQNNPWAALGYFSFFTKQLWIVHSLFVQESDKIIFTGLTFCPQTHRTPREENSYQTYVQWWEHRVHILHSFIHPSQVMQSKLRRLNISNYLHVTSLLWGSSLRPTYRETENQFSQLIS